MFGPKEIVKNDRFRLMITGTMSMTSYPYSLEVFNPMAEGWFNIIDLTPGDLADLIQLIKEYTEEK